MLYLLPLFCDLVLSSQQELPDTKPSMTLIAAIADQIGREKFKMLMYEALLRLEDEIGAGIAAQVVKLIAPSNI
jgi:hypothetical protein